jgi:hypothetical protein
VMAAQREGVGMVQRSGDRNEPEDLIINEPRTTGQ